MRRTTFREAQEVARNMQRNVQSRQRLMPFP
jgi:hypothetical protein